MKVMNFHRRILVLAFLGLFLFSYVSRTFAETNASDAQAILDDVESFLEKAYSAVAEAENSGANVAELKTQLGSAGDLLATANSKYNMGNFTGAVDYALQANASLNGIQDSTSRLVASAKEERSQRLILAIQESSLGISLAFLVVLVGWTYFRWRYIRRVLDMKPEVGKSES